MAAGITIPHKPYIIGYLRTKADRNNDADNNIIT